jgi:hypothetical protein
MTRFYRLTAPHIVKHPDTGKSLTLPEGTIVVPDARMLKGNSDRLVPVPSGEEVDEDDVFIFGRYYAPPRALVEGSLTRDELAQQRMATDAAALAEAREAIEEAGGIDAMKKDDLVDVLAILGRQVEQGTGARGNVTVRDLREALREAIGS